MIPILFDATSTIFTTNGIGRLSDAKSCKVTEERNGEYELQLKYPLGGLYFNEIQNERIILAKPFKNGKNQAFRIYSITDDLDGNIEVLANHISYDANYIPIKPFNATGITATLSGLADNNLEDNPFTVTALGFDNEESRYQQIEPKSLRACLGGSDGSILDVFSSHGHGEYEWDNYDIKFHYNRGSNNGYVIRYSKNLTEYERERDSSEIATGCLAYWKNDENNVVYYSDIQYSDLYNVYPIKKTVTVNATEDFETAPTGAQLNAYALAYVNSLSELSESIDISFYDIDDQDINLCDTVRVLYSYKAGGKTVKVIDYTTKIIKAVWNVLLDRYDSITVGDNRSTLNDTLNDKIEKAQEAAMSVINNKMVSVVQYVDEEIGKVSTTISEIDVVSIKQQYFLADSDTYIPEETQENKWYDSIPEITKGKYLWTRNAITHSDGTTEYTEPILSTDLIYQTLLMAVETATEAEQTAKGFDFSIYATTTQLNSLGQKVDDDEAVLSNYSKYITFDLGGITIRDSEGAIQGNFDNGALKFLDSTGSKQIAWVSGSNSQLGANELSIGDHTNESNRWRVFTGSNGVHLIFTRHD